jgi:HAD superfamily hydrolase (TIGR01459 family)
MNGPVPRLPLADLAGRYNVFLMDQFGTLHDGVRLYDGALAAMRRLRAFGRVVLFSNSGRRSKANARRLSRLGLPDDAYDLMLTSGEVAWTMLRDNRAATGPARTCLLLSREGDTSPIDGLGLVRVWRAEEAELVVIAGSEGERISLAEYEAMLRPAASRGVAALCLNPDRIMLTALGPAFGAGRIAELYETLGGTVKWIGKPHREIYEAALRMLGDPDRRRVIGIGDSVEHDVAGAKAAGCDAALVLTGIAADFDDAAIAAECVRWHVWPDAVLRALASSDEAGARIGIDKDSPV